MHTYTCSSNIRTPHTISSTHKTDTCPMVIKCITICTGISNHIPIYSLYWGGVGVPHYRWDATFYNWSIDNALNYCILKIICLKLTV